MTSTGVEGRPRARLRVSAAEVLADGVEELVVVEQAIELLEPGLEAEARPGDQGEQVGPIVAVAEHAPSVQNAGEHGHFAPRANS
jgi:hypothetical protein